MNGNTDQLLGKLTGNKRSVDEPIIEALAGQADDALVSRLRDELVDAHWPRCDALAEVLARIESPAAVAALTESLRAKRHHIRTAAIRGLVATGDASVAPTLERMLADSAYETRMAAKEGIRALTGQDVKTARGE